MPELKYERLTDKERTLIVMALKLAVAELALPSDDVPEVRHWLEALADDLNIGIAKVLYAPAHVWRETRIVERKTH